MTISWLVLLIALFTLFINCNGNSDVYIVYMGDRLSDDLPTTALHKSILHSTLGREKGAESWLYSYTRSFNGFVAKLSDEEREKIANMEGVVSVFPNTKMQLHTTRSWDFTDLSLNVERAQTESDIIIGMLDSGIWPESQSFNDQGFGPPPPKWKGTCQSSSNFTCNNKIIGAKYYRVDGAISPPNIPSPRDTNGHGTHTASTAAGGLVSNANLYGIASGTARGGVPSARIAVYKVCWTDGCYGADLLAAFDDAIADGVDIISLSVGGGDPVDYINDPIAIGAFHAMRNGILTSNSAGNSGPNPGSVSNYSPWSLTVAASTIDRKFLSKVQLGNNLTYEGIAVNTFSLMKDNYPLVYGGNVPNRAAGFDESTSVSCTPGSLDPKLVKGTIVLCQFNGDTEGTASSGASGAIYYASIFNDFAQAYAIPASYLGDDDGAQVLDYINKTSNPTATIFKSTEANDTSPLSVASFSSRGPNPITPNILKPDLTAPGVDILAAWSEASTVTESPEDTRVVPYNIISGTSMSCPHATAAAAYVKSFNPTWSPAAIKSALMTTATAAKSQSNDSEFAYGSGHINPVKAKSPGLVYDMGESDYVRFLCGLGYSNDTLQLITGDDATCTETKNKSSTYDLNYPSFAVHGNAYGMSSIVFHRTVTNVGSPTSTYRAVVAAPTRMSIEVQPSTLTFTSLGEKQSFAMTVNVTVSKRDILLSGSLVWDDGVYQVRTPLVAFNLPTDYDGN